MSNSLLNYCITFGLVSLVACSDKEETEEIEEVGLHVGDNDQDGYQTEDDCDDDNYEIYPDAPDSVGDDIDQNCDGIDGVDKDGDGLASVESGGTDCNDEDVDEDASTGSEFFTDADGDGYGDSNASVILCELQDGYADNADDCDEDDWDYKIVNEMLAMLLGASGFSCFLPREFKTPDNAK